MAPEKEIWQQKIFTMEIYLYTQHTLHTQHTKIVLNRKSRHCWIIVFRVFSLFLSRLIYLYYLIVHFTPSVLYNMYILHQPVDLEICSVYTIASILEIWTVYTITSILEICTVYTS